MAVRMRQYWMLNTTNSGSYRKSNDMKLLLKYVRFSVRKQDLRNTLLDLRNLQESTIEFTDFNYTV